MYKIPISGGPHAGKTTILEALKTEFPEAHFLAEPAEIVISRELIKQEADPDYVPSVPWLDYSKFCPLVIEESLRLESEIPADAALVFQDRSLIDNIGYARLHGLDEFVLEAQRLTATANYAFALFCEPVGTYTATKIRRESPDEARLIHDSLAEAYNASGLDIVHLPPVSVEDRLAIIRTTMHSAIG